MELDLTQFGTCKIEGFPSFPHTALISEKLLLRAPRLDDFKEWLELRASNESHLQPFEPAWGSVWKTPAHFQKRTNFQRQEWQQDRAYCFLIFKRDEDNKLIGGVNINNVIRGSAQFASLGYWIAKDYEGQGLMSEALDVTIKFCFDVLLLKRINIAVLDHNTRSKKLVERFGFEYEGTAKRYIEINGTRQDHLLYGLNASKETE
ncbi:MAG: GNAT family N-acetyltransferase [Bdellovibrionales bacterium]